MVERGKERALVRQRAWWLPGKPERPLGLGVQAQAQAQASPPEELKQEALMVARASLLGASEMALMKV